MSASSEPVFRTPRPESRSRVVSCRLTPTQDAALDQRAAALGIDRADAVRVALDFWFARGAPGPKP